MLLTVAVNAQLARHQQSVQSELMTAQDMSPNAISNMKALKIYAWEHHFREVIRVLRESVLRWLCAYKIWEFLVAK